VRRTGDQFIATAEYRPDCGCSVLLAFERDAIAPACPICHHAVTWVFVRSPWIERGPKIVLPNVKHPPEPGAAAERKDVG